MSRKNARVLAYQLIFGYVFTKVKNDELLAEYQTDDTLSMDDKEYIGRLYEGVVDKYDELIFHISDNLHGYTIDRVYKSDLAAMLLAVYEIKYMDDIPNKVALNEALEIVKDFSEERSSKFVNGVLAGVLKSL
ncbi:MAG: transcription antitermination factor NusB [Clostridia bacterium]|nr:transcription antitermination factor NusB [Clostridia bacterium]